MTVAEPLYRTRTTCRVSGEPLQPVLDLGELVLSGFVKPDEPDPPRAPLALMYAPQSGLVQLRDTVDMDRMYRNYWYRSGTNEMMRRHLKELAQDALERLPYPLDRTNFILDIGCNDGTLLEACRLSPMRKVGFDPSNVNPRDGSMDLFVNDYFSLPALAGMSAHGYTAALVFSIAMFYDIEDPVQFARDVASILDDDGVWVLEMHYLPSMLATVGFDAICHEHLSYFSLTALSNVMELAGLRVLDVSLNAVNGGSMRVYVGKRGTPTPQVATLMAMEQRSISDMLSQFEQSVEANYGLVKILLHNLRKDGKRVAGIGASTKFNTMLQYYGLTADDLPYIADRDPHKHGLVTAGTRIPIVSEETMREDKPDYLLVGPYHFLPSLMERERAWLDAGGQFIVPVPSPHIVGA